MAYEVVVVGGGIGGLTAAALLAARGVNVCLLERAGEVGGCAASFQKLGFTFEQGASLYYSWGKGELHDRVFAELPVNPPEVREISPAYVVRLPDFSEIAITRSDEEQEVQLRAAFPECADAAVLFFRELTPIADALDRVPSLYRDRPNWAVQDQQETTAHQHEMARRLLGLKFDTVGQHLTGCSNRFHRFIDVQLQLFAQTHADDCSYLYAAIALTLPRRGTYEIKGGASSLARALAESLKKSGGTLRLNSPVLRIAYGGAGEASGVELLNGEKIDATRAIISNLTVWDTYGKLVGINRIPASIRAQLKKMRGWGAYLLYLSIDERCAEALKARHLLALTEWQANEAYDPEQSQLMFTCAPDWDTRGPLGKRAVTVCTCADVDEWFSFHEDESEFEQMDQSKLERWWDKLHIAMPELGSSVEIIETATPRSFYESTRRRLGMVGGIRQSVDSFEMSVRSHNTAIPNLYMVGDSTFPGQGLAAVTLSALIVADELASSHPG